MESLSDSCDLSLHWESMDVTDEELIAEHKLNMEHVKALLTKHKNNTLHIFGSIKPCLKNKEHQLSLHQAIILRLN